MRKHRSIYRKRPLDFLHAAILPVLFTAVIVTAVSFGLGQTEKSGDAERLLILEDSLRRAVVMNYAIEGRYPESIEYIEKKFGLHVDRTKFIVHYSIFATNIFPEITVILA